MIFDIEQMSEQTKGNFQGYGFPKQMNKLSKTKKFVHLKNKENVIITPAYSHFATAMSEVTFCWFWFAKTENDTKNS